MKSLHDPVIRKQIESRIHQLKSTSRPLWGKMDANQMLVHCTDQLRLAIGESKGMDQSSLIRRTMAKWAVLYAIGFPKGQKTIREMDPAQSGTSKTDFEGDRKLLLTAIQNFCLWDQRKGYGAHPYFGSLTADQWGNLAYRHLDYHLGQFGCK